MIERVCLLLEALSVIICLHHLYGERLKLDIWTSSLIAIDLIIMLVIKYYGFSKIYTLVIYPIIMVYCGIKFGFKWKELIINNILYLIIIGGIQIITAICYGCLFKMLSFNMLILKKNELLIINSVVLIIVLIILPKLKIHELSVYLQDKEKILVVFLIFCILATISCLTNYRLTDGFKGYQNLLIFVNISLFCALAGKLGKYKIRSKEIETELKMYKLFSDSFQGLIDDIRLRQHEFDNHISTIYSLHYTCDTYEKLVNAQNEYSQDIIKENRYNKLLNAGNPLLIGFLYGKFIEIEKLGVIISYNISIENLNVNVPIYKLVEILGNLIKNAVEAMGDLECPKALYVSVIEYEGELEIEVRNKSKFIDYKQIEMFFKKGFSRKGEDRGLGLYNVKNICDDYFLNILCENRIVNEENWICFNVNNKKETI